MDHDDQILALTPFERPDATLAAAACRAGAVGVLDLGRERVRALAALAELERLGADGAGVRLPADGVVAPGELPGVVRLVVLPAGRPSEPWGPRTVLAEVTSVEEARAAVAAGADGVIAKGSEAGGRIGDEGAFVLLQRVLDAVDVPVWAQGGMGPNAAAAAVAAGARGVLLDGQLALVRESTLPEEVRAAARAMDGSETRVVDGYRVYGRPDLPAAEGRVPQELGGESLARQVLPAGQDAALAAGLPETVGGVVRAVRRALRDNVGAAHAAGALRPDAPLARAHGIRYPVVQGPMTRVSDTAAFAEAVADGGGLPFLALALLRGADVRRLLEETAERLAGRTWGVGVLGFVPPELREEQLAAVHEVRPPVALVAGGRPAQARPLEEAGIATYLHVPSPALLDLFLRQGARRFVFEGRECGGHVGPRTSFLLWEQQLERLLAHDAPDELSVLFAGGIHDARSAAMVEVLAAPLAARGARLGVLMGTAYLFTEEAVRSGAVLPAFQDTALACTGTALLETGPGHATRCAETPYVESFRAERERLEREGRPRDEVWATLERLNVGRLRLAAKGIRRDGEQLVEAGEDERRRDGMVMLGQVAALRAERTTVADLHAEVSEGAGALLERALPARVRRPTAPRADVAIVGMASVFPGAAELEGYWANILAAADSVTEVPRERWNVDLYYDPAGDGSNDRTPSKWGGFLPDILFDPAAYGIPPVSLAAIEPIQLLALEVSRRALADAGLGDGGFDRERAAVIFGADSGADLLGAYTLRTFWKQYAGELPDALAEALPTLTEDSFPGVLANVIAGRIANRLDLGGANYTVDAACASSLAAVDVAVKELRTGTSDLVVCGGADLHCAISDYLMFASVHALSRTGRCRTFDASADGIALGEGVAAVVLKRLEDAQRDGDRVYAVVRGIGASSDGKSLGLTAPRREGQVRALERAYEAAGLSPAEIGLVEAHGTGTVVGDRTELETLTEVFSRAGAPVGGVALGSVKSQIGHTKCAAGLAGLVKTALALHRGVLPPTVHVDEPNPGWDGATSPFTLPAEPRPWPAERRAAAVSAFGFGGTNFHAVLSGADQAESGLPEWPAELVLLRGETAGEARTRAGALRGRLEAGERLRLRDLARSASAGEGPVQAAVVASDLADLGVKLEQVEAGVAGDGVYLRAEDAGGPGRVAFLFPGQGSQRVGMLRDIFVAFPHLRGYLELGRPFTDRIFPPTARSDEERAAQRAALTDTRVAQPALGVAGLAAAALLGRLGIRPDAAAGHSYGELVALAAAGALREDDLLFLSEKRGARILAAADAGDGDPGTMAAVGAPAADVKRLLAGCDGVVVANENAPDQVVVSGATEAVEEAIATLSAAGLTARRIPVACAFHSPLVAAAADTFAEDLATVQLASPSFPVYANTTAAPHAAEPDAIRSLLAEHVRSPVRFAAEIEAMYADGVRTFVEAGPGRVLTNLVGRILGGRPHLAVALDDPPRHGLEQLLRALGELSVHGVPFEADTLYAGRGAELADLGVPPAPLPATAWWVSGHRARPVHGEPPAHGLRPVLEPVVIAPTLAAAPNGDRETVVLEYLRSVRELVDAQRRVVLAYLGDTAPEAAAVLEATTAAEALPLPPTPALEPEPPDPGATPRDLLLAVVSERTGYPIEMLDLDLDLEAELSVDSIKRIEILGALAERVGLAAEHAEVPEELAAAKTLRAILAWLETLGRTAREDEEPALRPAASAGDAVEGPPFGRFVLELADAEAAAPAAPALAGSRFLVVPDRLGVAEELTRRLAALGVMVTERAEDADGLVDLSPLDGGVAGRVGAVFARVRAAALGGARWIVVATPLGGGFGRTLNGSLPLDAGGLAGLVKTVAKEYPDRHVRAVDLHPDRDPAALAAHVLDELLAGDRLAEVGYDGTARRVLRPVPVSWNGATGIALGPESVVLLTGGARGITARTALELARRFGCRLELVGRSPEPGPANGDGELAAATDLTQLRGLLARRGEHATPAEVEAAARRILAENEIRATLAALRAAGSDVRYHGLDVRDAGALAGLVEEVRARHGRLDGIVHGAGVIEDKLLRDKTPESFARVWDTKAAAAATLAAAAPDDLRFLVFFSSVSGAFGNPGQADYAAANDFLDKLAVALNGRLAARVVSINWGPWANGGMVSAELEREYARRGVGLIAPDEGAASFVDELLHGGPDDAQVILTRAEPSALA